MAAAAAATGRTIDCPRCRGFISVGVESDNSVAFATALDKNVPCQMEISLPGPSLRLLRPKNRSCLAAELNHRNVRRWRAAWAHHGEGTGGVEQNRCGPEGPLISPSSNDGKNENPKSEEFLDSEVHNLGERVRF